LPILAGALRRLDAGEDFVMLEDLRAELGLDLGQMRAGLKALASARPPYVEVSYSLAGGTLAGSHLDAVSERARRELGTWPSPDDVIDRLVVALSQAAEVEPDAQRKSRFRSAAESLAGMARDIAVQAIAARLGTLK
jgi:hypothetical protein